MRYYMPFGPSEYFVWRRHDARRAVQDLIERADAAIADPRPSADLRFIHDSGITSMMSLMGICELDYTTTDYATLHEHWAIYRITPMATNLQIMFYRSPASDEVLVKLLLCEREVSLPSNPATDATAGRMSRPICLAGSTIGSRFRGKLRAA